MSDSKPKKMTNPEARPTARDALVYAAGINHGHCTVKAKGRVRDEQIAFKCVCNTTYVVKANRFIDEALRNVPEDKSL